MSVCNSNQVQAVKKSGKEDLDRKYQQHHQQQQHQHSPPQQQEQFDNFRQFHLGENRLLQEPQEERARRLLELREGAPQQDTDHRQPSSDQRDRIRHVRELDERERQFQQYREQSRYNAMER